MEINKDYIGVLKETNGLLSVKWEKIDQDNILVDELKAMRENPNRSVLDMQDAVDRLYPEKVHKDNTLDYLYPISYNMSYVGDARFPEFLLPQEYKKEIAHMDKELRQIHMESPEAKKKLGELKRKLSAENYEVEVKKRLALISKALKDKKENYKKNFRPERYIYGYNYYKKASELCRKSNVKMITSDTIGWTDFRYEVNEDIVVYMKTNFGFGGSSYMFCNIMYKGICLLPYTAVVNYYYVGWTEFVRHTRKYRSLRENWEPVLDFVAETANLAKSDPEAFINEWIVNELKEMMAGLRKVLNSPDSEIRKHLNVRTDVPIQHYNLVRNCYHLDQVEYKVLPHEKTIAFKAEKITGCLKLLENLNKLKEISPYVQKCINEIISMNRIIKPEITSHVDNIEADVKRLESELSKVLDKKHQLEMLINPHKKAIKTLLEQMNKEAKKYHMIYGFGEAERKYEKEHREYSRLKEKLSELVEKEDEVRKHIALRQKFVGELERCLERIERYTVAA